MQKILPPSLLKADQAKGTGRLLPLAGPAHPLNAAAQKQFPAAYQKHQIRHRRPWQSVNATVKPQLYEPCLYFPCQFIGP